MLLMVIERFKNGDPIPVYKQFERDGRSIPDGLTYVNSWVSEDLTHCYQVMECDDEAVLLEWISAWTNHIDFEIVPVVTSAEAMTKVLDQDTN